MQCLIIAAGQGSRLRSRAASKPLAEIAGRPLIEHIVRRAQAGGATKFLVVTGYAAEPIEAFLAGLARDLGIEIETARNDEWQRPNGLSVLAAAPKLEASFLLLMSDHLFDPDMLAMLVAEERRSALTLAVDYRVDNPLIDLDDATKVDADEAGRIVRLSKALTEFNAIDTGLFRAGPALIEALQHSIAHGGSGSLSEGVQILADQKEARVLDTGTRWWLDVDDPRALELAQAALGGAKKLI